MTDHAPTLGLGNADAARRQLMPTWEEDPIRRGGRFVADLFSGFGNQAPLSQRLTAQVEGQNSLQLAREKLRWQKSEDERKAVFEKTRLGAELVAQAVERIGGMNNDDAEKVLNQYTNNFGEATGINFTEAVTLVKDSKISVNALMEITGSKLVADNLIEIFNGNLEAIVSALKDPEFRSGIYKSLDANEGEGRINKLARVMAVVEGGSTGRGVTAGLEIFLAELPRDSTGNMIVTEFDLPQLNKFLPKGDQLDRGDFSYWERHPQGLAQAGIVLGTTTVKQQEYKPLAVIAAEAAAKAAGTATGTPEAPIKITPTMSAELRREATSLVGGFYDAVTQVTKGLTPYTSRKVARIIADAETLILSGAASSAGIATQMAFEAIEREEVTVVPPDEAPSPITGMTGGKRISELFVGSGIGRFVSRMGRLVIGNLAEVVGIDGVMEFPELAQLDTALGLFKTRLFSNLRVEGQRLKVEAENILKLMPSSYDILQTESEAHSIFKDLTYRLNELRAEASALSKDPTVPAGERNEARAMARKLPGLINDLYLTAATPEDLDSMAIGTTAFVLSTGTFQTRYE